MVHKLAGPVQVDKVHKKMGPTEEGCDKCAGKLCHGHSEACRARVEALVAADPEARFWLENEQKRISKREWRMAKRAEVGAEPSRRDRGAELSEEQRAPSPPDATAAAGFSAVPVQGEARGRLLTLRGGDSRRRSEGTLRFFL